MHSKHYRKLEHMYLHAPLHQFYNTLTIQVTHSRAVISLNSDLKYFHAGGSMHGSVIFKLLDDAAFFAAQSLVDDYFLLTASFNIHFMRPVTEGLLTATGSMKFKTDLHVVAEASLINTNGKEVAFGTGQFVKSKWLLKDVEAYKL